MPNDSDKDRRPGHIPSIDELLRSDVGRQIEAEEGRTIALAIAREAADRIRKAFFSQGSGNLSDIEAAMLEIRSARRRLSLRRVINATGVIIHTNLGRSRLSKEATARAVEAASSYCNLEFDIATGKRGRRGAGAEAAIAELTKAEDAVVVNNCAAAALLVLKEFAAGREVIISRGELVEIGGDFRIPDVLAQSGAILREVGTTNRTKISDYERAINERTAVLMRVHPSNFRITGFTKSPSDSELASLASRSGILFIEDAGSGALVDLSAFGLADEPVIEKSIACGADLVLFSGDKLLGGPQSGIIAGRAKLIERLRRNPLLRALRADKVVYAALEATLAAYQKGTHFREIPTLRMLSETKQEIDGRARTIASELRNRVNAEITVIEGNSAVGGGAAPNASLPTYLIAIRPADNDLQGFAERLRLSSPPVIARISDEMIVLDLRTVEQFEEPELIAAVVSAAEKSSEN